MKLIKFVLFLIMCINAWAVQAKCSQFSPKDQNVERFTDIPDVNGDEVRWEQGTLSLQSGFIPATSSDYGLSIFNLTPAVLSQISGQTVMSLSLWTNLENAGVAGVPAGALVCNFSRSAATYSINNVPYVIVTPKLATVKKPKVSISASDPSASETAGDPGQFLISLSAPSDRGIRVKLETSGKAKRNRDYTGIPKAVFVPAGSVSAVVNVVPVDDTAAEGPETVIVKLPSGGNSYSARGKASLVINDND